MPLTKEWPAHAAIKDGLRASEGRHVSEISQLDQADEAVSGRISTVSVLHANPARADSIAMDFESPAYTRGVTSDRPGEDQL